LTRQDSCYPTVPNCLGPLPIRGHVPPLDQADEAVMASARVVRVQNRGTSFDGPWLHNGCIFDVQRTSPDQQDSSYVWAYGRVVRCDELSETA